MADFSGCFYQYSYGSRVERENKKFLHIIADILSESLSLENKIVQIVNFKRYRKVEVSGK